MKQVRGEEAITLFHSIAVNTKKYDQVFRDELGSMKDITVKQHVKPDSKPVFLNARPVPYALRPKVEADLDAMVAMLWPRLLFRCQKNSGFRICGDLKVTLNPLLVT